MSLLKYTNLSILIRKVIFWTRKFAFYVESRPYVIRIGCVSKDTAPSLIELNYQPTHYPPIYESKLVIIQVQRVAYLQDSVYKFQSLEKYLQFLSPLGWLVLTSDKMIAICCPGLLWFLSFLVVFLIKDHFLKLKYFTNSF